MLFPHFNPGFCRAKGCQNYSIVMQRLSLLKHSVRLLGRNTSWLGTLGAIEAGNIYFSIPILQFSKIFSALLTF
jgi:hypothetical protein